MIFQNTDSRHQTIEEAIKKWQPLIRELAYRFSNRIVDRDDLIHEGVCAIIRGIDRFKPVGSGSLNTFLYRCIYNEMRAAAYRGSFVLSVPSGSVRILRKLQSINPLAYDAIRGQVLTSDDELDLPDRFPSMEGYTDLLDLIQHVDTDNVCYLHWVEGRTYEEISLITGLSVTTVFRIITRGKELIQAHLND